MIALAIILALAGPSKPANEHGVLRIPGASTITLLVGDDVKKVQSDGAGLFRLKPGTYQLASLVLVRRDDRDGAWSAEVRAGNGIRSVCIIAGRTTDVKCGPPFKMAAKLGNDSDRRIYQIYRREATDLGAPGPRDLIVRAACQDAYGNRVLMIHGPDGSKALPPVVRARGIDGSLVATVHCEYG